MTDWTLRSATSTAPLNIIWGPWMGGYTSAAAAKRYLNSLGDIWWATETALKEDGRWYVRLGGEGTS